MAKQAKEVLKTETLEAVADRGYFSSLEFLACHEAGITVTLSKPQTSGCLFAGGRRLSLSGWRATAISLYERGRWQADKALLDHSLSKLSLKPQCTTGPERRIPRWEHEHLLDAVQQRLDETHKPCVSVVRQSSIRPLILRSIRGPFGLPTEKLERLGGAALGANPRAFGSKSELQAKTMV